MTIALAQVLDHCVVVFSKNYLPISRVNIRRAMPLRAAGAAIALMVTGKAEALDFTGETWLVRSPNLVIAVPQHIRLTIASTEQIWKIPPVNRREVLKRDNHSCQYCGSNKHLTLDHVIPVSKGGKHKWDNVVTACQPCNQRKRDLKPFEAAMPLRTKPKAPMHPTVNFWHSKSACSP